MRVIAKSGRDDLATVYVAEFPSGRCVEFAESVQPSLGRDKKWVLIISTMFGCPIGCLMCDAGGSYAGRLTKEEMISQIDYLVAQRFPDGRVRSEKFKIQFARIGEPSLNPAVLDALRELASRYSTASPIASISTMAPHSTDAFFETLCDIKNQYYAGGKFQMQFSIHTTDLMLRDRIVPTKKWSFAEIASFGEKFYARGDRKIALNFALADGMPVDAAILKKHFDPKKFLIKMTPINPTYTSIKNRLSSHIDPHRQSDGIPVVMSLRNAGYEVIVSIGETEENLIGSNCGQYLLKHIGNPDRIAESYTYPIERSMTSVR